ncbi:MAG: ATP-binding protein [Candidatus Sumerlaeaceae bacterium]
MPPASKGNFPPASARHFASVVGHDLIKRYLLAALEKEVLPHALLFHGPKGVGKLSMAYALTKHLNCGRGSVDECPCNMCRKITEGIFADVLLVEPRGAAGQITLSGWKPGKDDPDALQYYRFIDTRPLEGARKVLIIRDAERMNIALANYILKLIEEPPSYLTLVLLTQRRGDVLTTIRSRCAPVKFSPLPMDEMRQLARVVVGEEALQQEVDALAHVGDGRPGQLPDYVGDTATARRRDLAHTLQLFQQYGFVALFRAASELQQETEGGRGGEQSDRVLNMLTTWFRDAAIVKCASPATADKLLVNSEIKAELQAFAQALPMESLARAADLIPHFKPFSSRQMDPNYVLESLLLQIGRTMRPVS